MIFIVSVGKIGALDAWDEEYERDVTDPEAWAKETIAQFNAHLKPYETPREVLGVRVIDARPPSPHTWVRARGCAEDMDDDQYEIECAVCGVTGYHISHRDNLDYRYRSTQFKRCDTAKEFLEKEEHERE